GEPTRAKSGAGKRGELSVARGGLAHGARASARGAERRAAVGRAAARAGRAELPVRVRQVRAGETGRGSPEAEVRWRGAMKIYIPSRSRWGDEILTLRHTRDAELVVPAEQALDYRRKMYNAGMEEVGVLECPEQGI